MSTISPLLDTLLHHVLGRRGELERYASPPREPVMVSRASEVQGRPYAEPGAGGPASPTISPLNRGGASAELLPELADGGRISTGEKASLSRDALVIAQLLARFPQPDSVIRLVGISPGQATAVTQPSASAELSGGVESPRLAPPMRLDAAVIASTLRDGVIDSGLFYERHLALALADKWTLTRLALEPQARASSAPDSSIEGELALLVRHQLELLGGEPLRLQFPLHGGVVASLAISLSEEEENGQSGDGDAGEEDRLIKASYAPHWRISVTVELPALGRVEAIINRHSDGLRIELQSASEAVRTVLAEDSQTLEAGLDDQGLVLVELSVAALDAKATEAKA